MGVGARVSAVLCLLTVGCASWGPNTNPNILGEAPYNRVRYAAQPPSGSAKVDTIEVVRKGEQANILSTVPALYSEAAARAEKDFPQKDDVFVTGISVSAYTRREAFQVPYQECQTRRTYEYVSERECTSRYDYYSKRTVQDCRSVMKNKPVEKRECKTVYKTEIKDVLYQKVLGDVYVGR